MQWEEQENKEEEPTWLTSHGQVVSSQHLEVFIFASGVEYGHLGLDGEDEAFP